ncbi:MAG: xanthine dehydrogenase family protein molybdopterin-binding subunit [Alphaproteobacteria bacterium]|nr:xanthine dehydrogenase family protein molybdopterin-binding subunit [Alphaproteobacteria bacterium]
MDDSIQWGQTKFGVGQPVPRREDPTLLRGEGKYTDDVNLPSQAWCAIVRSRHAHGVIKKIDLAAAKAMPGVLGAWTGEDLNAAGYGALKCAIAYNNRDGSPMKKPERRSLATGKVRYVGDPVAFVVAETKAQARDAAEAVEVDIEDLLSVTDAREAAKPGAPQLFDDVPDNLVLDWHYGEADKVKEAFAKAAHVTKLPLISNRIVVSAMEPRSAVGSYDKASGRWTFYVGSQGVFGFKNSLADLLGEKPENVRIITGNVGGSFGMKAGIYPEYACILHAARLLGRPVKWTDDRSESFLSDCHGRDHDFTGELALDKDGRFLAVRFTGYANMGAVLNTAGPLMSTINIVKNSIGVYRTPLIEVSTKCIMTNTVPINAYRGAGRPEGNYFMERLVAAAAAEMGIDQVELRKRNHIRPDQIPYKAPSAMEYDSGDFSNLLAKAAKAADWDGFAKRRAGSKSRGLLRGIGIGNYLEVTAPQGKEMGGLRFEANGDVTIVTGTLDYGQGHWSPFAQVLVDKLGIPFEKIKLHQNDSDQLIGGGGTGGSRSAMASGGAIIEAGDKVVEKGKQVAAHVLEAAAADIEFSQGRFVIAGTDRSIGIMGLADKLRSGIKLPGDVPKSLDVSLVHDTSPSAFPNGCHICEVEIDPETGHVQVVKYSSVSDFGTILNPLMVAGQTHGGIVQGIGQALLERTVYDADGQFLTGSYMDYALPRAADTCDIGFISHPVPATTNALGAKGCGEAGCAGSLPAVMNAVVDALRQVGVKSMDMPATPERVWRAIQAARG